MNHPVDRNKMVCRHTPSEPVAAFTHVCKHCHAPIEAVHCVTCNGHGIVLKLKRRDEAGVELSEVKPCSDCGRSGIDRWEVAS